MGYNLTPAAESWDRDNQHHPTNDYGQHAVVECACASGATLMQSEPSVFGTLTGGVSTMGGMSLLFKSQIRKQAYG